jgi:hypothetical protein
MKMSNIIYWASILILFKVVVADIEKLKQMTPVLKNLIEARCLNLKGDVVDLRGITGKTGYGTDVLKLIVE